MQEMIRFTLNGKPVEMASGEKRSLLWALRNDLDLTGTKFGCGEGLCGACTVLVDGVAQRSCLLDIADVANRKATTIEGLANGGERGFRSTGLSFRPNWPAMADTYRPMLEKNLMSI